jgi:hypothetical protein
VTFFDIVKLRFPYSFNTEKRRVPFLVEFSEILLYISRTRKENIPKLK